MIPIDALFEASKYDKKIKIRSADLTRIKKKYLSPINFSKKLLFDSMFNGKTVVFNNYPIENKIPRNQSKVEATLALLRNNLKKNDKIFIRYGSNRTLKKVTINNVIDRWLRGRSKFGVTDLHFRHTNYFAKIDADAISYFNLLPLFPEEVSFLEMLTLVISSKGIFSDSHSDDGDGSNHCIIGKKLWFAWDKIEGETVGLQNCSFDSVYSQAKFSIDKFLSLKSAHWFLVSEGQTLFMPGNFTHKVITLESYIGFGSFYVSFPNYINSIKRWLLHYSSDVTTDFINILNTKCIKYIRETVQQMDSTKQEEIGFNYFLKAVLSWEKGLTKNQINEFASNTSTRNLLMEGKTSVNKSICKN